MKHSHGNILFVVLLGIVLFGALNFTVLRSSEEDVVINHDAYADANQLIQYGESLRQAVAYLRTNHGCTLKQLNFDPPPFDGSVLSGDYINPNSPTDFSCHVFHPNGGKASYRLEEFADMFGIEYASNRIAIGEGSDLRQIGTTECASPECTEVYLSLVTNTETASDICSSYNKILGNETLIPTPIVNYVVHAIPYTGSFTLSHMSNRPAFIGLKSFCFVHEANNDIIYFMYVLIER
tara:strand:- start:2235 stop:2945 length:711 start_codon:yes stop_codon:yes gene_type:complete